MTRILVPLIFGLAGTAMLVALGVWQMQRLAWKEAILTDIRDTISAPAEPLPRVVSPSEQRYQPVEIAGEIGEGELHVLVSVKRVGAGYRIIAPFTTDTGRTVLIDRGFTPTEEKDTARRTGPATITGNLHWPDERADFTPENDTGRNIWFAREVGVMAEALGTEPLMVIVRSEDPPEPGLSPLPVSTQGIPNDHLQYAITWFSLAAIWIGMTAVFLLRGRFATESTRP